MPETKIKVTIDYKRCNPRRCSHGICKAVLACPNRLLKQLEPNDYPFIIHGFCNECGKCVESCPLGVISML